MNHQLEVVNLDKLPDKEVIRTFNNHHDQLELLMTKVLQLEAQVSNLMGRQ